MKVPRTSVHSKSEAKAVLARIYPNGKPAPDWETVGLDTEFKPLPDRGGYLVHYMQISNGKEKICIDGPGVSAARRFKDRDLIKLFGKWINDPKVHKHISTVGAEYRALQQYAGELRGLEVDTEVADAFIDENRKHNLKLVASDCCDIFMRTYADTFGFVPDGKKKPYVPNMDEIVWGSDKYDYIPWTGEEGRKKAEKYACLDPYASFVLGEWQKKKLKKLKLWDWYYEVERRFAITLVRMEDRGIGIDSEVIKEVRRKNWWKVLRTRHLFRGLVDKPSMNLRSNPQLKALFFDELGWPVVKKSKKSKQPSLDKDAMAIYAEDDYALAKLLIEHRLYAHEESSFLRKIDDWRDVDGLLRTKFWQAVVVTGRLSSGARKERKTNLQNIPAMKEKDPWRIRRVFIPGKKHYKLIVGDYSQIELYIVADVSGDKVMCRVFNKGGDLHITTACKVYNLKDPGFDPKAIEAFKEKYDSQRKKSKTINFGLNYLMSAKTLAERLKCEEEEAQEYIDAYFELYEGVAEWQQMMIETAHDKGYVTTRLGRRRHLEEIHAAERWIREHAERQAVNFPIQGEAAEIIKIAMNCIEYGPKVMKKYADMGLCDYVPEVELLQEHGTELLLQVHDEVVCRSPEKYVEEDTKIVKKVMEASYAPIFKHVKHKASVGFGDNWAEAKH